jgi:hypothetical protein
MLELPVEYVTLHDNSSQDVIFFTAHSQAEWVVVVHERSLNESS